MTAPLRPTDLADDGQPRPQDLLPLIMRRVSLAEIERRTGRGDKWATRWADREDPHRLAELREICRLEREVLGSDELRQAVLAYLGEEPDDDDARPLLVDEDERDLVRLEAEAAVHRTHRPVQLARCRHAAAAHLRQAMAIEHRRRQAWRVYVRDYAAAIGLVAPWRLACLGALVVLVVVTSLMGHILPRRVGRGGRRDEVLTAELLGLPS